MMRGKSEKARERKKKNCFQVKMNEISPRSGLLRVREFTMAEIEHFCDPNDKSHPKFDDIRNVEMFLYSACNQMDGKPVYKATIGEAVDGGTVANQTLGYFMARIQQFLIKIGIDPQRLRFRQHMNNEMAHYACDCWDAELLTSYGWVECVGCADRSAFDLTQHTKVTGTKLVAEKKLKEPVTRTVIEIVPNKQVLGKAFKKEAKAVTDGLNALDADAVSKLEADLEANGKADILDGKFTVTKDMITEVRRTEKKFHVEEIIPSVIEPSFGVGRVMYALLEHTFRVREEDEQRTYFSLPAQMAPIKASVLPLSNNTEFTPLVKELSKSLTEAEISHRVDDSSGSIGKRYARTDEVAIPFGICIDFDSLKEPKSATIRERDTTLQVRMPFSDIPNVLRSLSLNKMSWDDVLAKYPKFEQQEATEKK